MTSLRAAHIVNKDNELWFCPYCETALEVDDLKTNKEFSHIEKCDQCNKKVVIDNRIDEVYYE